LFCFKAIDRAKKEINFVLRQVGEPEFSSGWLRECDPSRQLWPDGKALEDCRGATATVPARTVDHNHAKIKHSVIRDRNTVLQKAF